MERNIKPPIDILKRLIEITVVKHNKDIILFFEIEKCQRPNIGEYYKIHYSLSPDINFNLYEDNLKVLNIYRSTFRYLFNFFNIDKRKVRVQLGHWFFNIRALNNSLVLRTAPLPQNGF